MSRPGTRWPERTVPDGDGPVPGGPGPAGGPGEALPGGPGSQGAALLRLLVVVAAGLGLAIVLHGLAVLVVVLALVAMVMIHELGHFTAAKLSGMKVTEYFLGFGPRLWSVRRGETEYGVKAIPAGGYVRIVGMTAVEDVAADDEPRSYRQATFPRRLAVAMAGSFMHLVMAFLLLWAMYALAGMPTGSKGQVAGVARFASGPSPALQAGIRPGDVLVSVDGHRYGHVQQLIDFIQAHPGDRLTLVVDRAGHHLTVHVRPVNGHAAMVRQDGKLVHASAVRKAKDGIIGVELNVVGVQGTVNPLVAVPRAATMLGTLTAQTGQEIAKVFSFHGLGSFAHDVVQAGRQPTGKVSSGGSSGGGGQVLSILGAIQIGAQAASQDVTELLYILVVINLFLGMVNLFPMLPLDGGHVAIAIYERLRSRRGRPYHADVAKLMPVAYLFLLFMVVFGLGALYMNIVHPASLPGG